MARPNIFNRQYFIQKRFQGKFILFYALAVSAVVCLASWYLYLQIDAAVEAHLYRTHIKIEKVGDFLVDLLFVANSYSILAVVLTVLAVSLLIFKGINKTFTRMDDSITAMSHGDFSQPYRPGPAFAEVGQLASLLEKSRIANSARFEQISAALDIVAQGASGSGDLNLLRKGKAQLDLALNDLSLS